MRAEPLRTRELSLAVALTVVVVALRLLFAHQVSFCGTPDACFYLGTAQTLAAGHGFHARFLYDFQQPRPTLPNTGIEYWRPGISLLLLPLRSLGGVTLQSATDIAVLISVLFATAAWHIGARIFGDRRLALLGYALCLVAPTCWNGSLSPDSGLFYGAAVAWFLALFTVHRQGLPQDLLALGCVALAYLIRNDAALLLIPLATVLWCRRHLAGQSAGHPMPGSSVPYAAAMLAGFVVALIPMHLLYRQVLGTAFPSGTARVLFLNDLGDFSRYGEPVNLHTLLAPGLRHLLVLRAVTLCTVVYRVATGGIGYAALPFLIFPFLPILSRKLSAVWPDLSGPAVFAVTILIVYGLVLPGVGQFSALRTANGVLPLVFVLVALGLRRATPPGAGIALAITVLVLTALPGIMDARRELATKQHDGAHIRAEAAGLRALGADPGSAVVLAGDPVQLSVTTGFAAAQLPGNGPVAIAHAAHDLHATHILLDAGDVSALLPALIHLLHPIRLVPLPADHTLILELPRPPAS